MTVTQSPGDNPGLPIVTARIDVKGPTAVLSRPWWMVGAEHVSQLGYTTGPGPDAIGRSARPH